MIRQSKINLLKEKYGNMIDDEMVRNSLSNVLYFEVNVGPLQARERASQEYIHYGWLHKTSPTGTVSPKLPLSTV